MSREMRVFVTLIAWLFSVKGADGALTIKPENAVLVKGSVAPLKCASNGGTPAWTSKSLIYPDEDDGMDATEGECKSKIAEADTNHPDTPTCDLLVKGTLYQTTYRYSCAEGGDKASAFVAIIESPLKCGIEDNQYSCTMNNSVYMNTSEINTPFLAAVLIWRDDGGTIDGSKAADFATAGTTVKAPIPDAATRDSPHVCSAEFRMVGNLGTEYSAIIHIIPDGKLECKYPVTAAHEEEAAAAAAEAAAAKEAGGNRTSDAKPERDGIDAIAMLMSLMAAFLVV